MKTLLLAGLGMGLLSFVPQSKADGISVDFRFGSGGRYRHSDDRREGYRHPYYYSHGPVFFPQRVVVVRQPEVCETPARASFYDMGHDWARDLRQDVVSRGQFVAFLRDNMLRVSNEDYRDFRNGFVEAYGSHGEAAFAKYYQDARSY